MSSPSITQIEMIEVLNKSLGTDYPIPNSTTDAKFLIDGLIDEERQMKRSQPLRFNVEGHRNSLS